MFAVRDSRYRMHVHKQRAVDRISDLPPNLTQSILQCLPLRDAARTSILSTHWRHKWLSIPWVVLDDKFVEAVMEKIKMRGTLDTSQAYWSVVNNIMLRHVGPVHKFVFRVPSCVAKGMDISDWVQFASNHGVKEFTLHNSYFHPKVKLPSCLFSYAGLTHLTLINAYFPSLPSTFRGFPSLISLQVKMSSTGVEENSLQALISNSPQLETLHFCIFKHDFFLTICAPKLQELVVDGLLAQMCLAAGTTKLNTLAIHASFEEKVNMTQLFSCVPNVEKLIFSGLFWRNFHSLGSNNVGCQGKLANELERLKTLKLLKLPCTCSRAILFAICMLRSSPHVQQLIINADASGQECCTDGLPEVEEYCSLQCLKYVQLTCISRLSCWLQFIKLLLTCSPVLENMVIELSEGMGGAEEKLKMAKELMLYDRASPKARIIFKP